jgi:hypothetical protein
MTADGCSWRPMPWCTAMLSMAPSEGGGDGMVAGREGMCWSVVSNGLRCQRSSEDASISGVACRTLIHTTPVILRIARKATPNSLRQARHRKAANASPCDCCLLVGDAPIVVVPHRRFVGVATGVVPRFHADSALLLRHPPSLPRSARRSCLVALFASRRIGKEPTTPARRSFREMRLT